jgi:hypothetical protein
MGLALVRRFLTNLVPQNYDMTFGETRVGDYKQNFNPFTYELNFDFSMDTAGQLDRRLGIAAGILLAAVEGQTELIINRRGDFLRVAPTRGKRKNLNMPNTPSSLVSSWMKHAACRILASLALNPAYVVDDDGFKRHIPAEQVDRAVLAIKWRR